MPDFEKIIANDNAKDFELLHSFLHAAFPEKSTGELAKLLFISVLMWGESHLPTYGDILKYLDSVRLAVNESYEVNRRAIQEGQPMANGEIVTADTLTSIGKTLQHHKDPSHGHASTPDGLHDLMIEALNRLDSSKGN